jgi:hypothetical protein
MDITLLPILIAEEIHEYVPLWQTIQHIELDTDRENNIVWH